MVTTYIDKHHVYDHIIIFSTVLDCQHKNRDVKKSDKDLILLSDSLCHEHGFSVIQYQLEITAFGSETYPLSLQSSETRCAVRNHNAEQNCE